MWVHSASIMSSHLKIALSNRIIPGHVAFNYLCIMTAGLRKILEKFQGEADLT